MRYNDKNPQHRKQLEEHLTGGPTRTSLAMQKDLLIKIKLLLSKMLQQQENIIKYMRLTVQQYRI